MKADGFTKPLTRPELDLSSFVHLKFYLPRSIDNPLFRQNQPTAGSIDASSCGKHISVDWNMKMMDSLWNASLYEFIKGQENCECVARYIAPILQDYTLLQITQGLEWYLTIHFFNPGFSLSGALRAKRGF